MLSACDTGGGRGNLDKVWNRMSSGSSFPPPVRLVEIAKDDGGKRPLGIPTVADRVAQTVVKMILEPCVEPVFHRDSYGYRPGKDEFKQMMSEKRGFIVAGWMPPPPAPPVARPTGDLGTASAGSAVVECPPGTKVLGGGIRVSGDVDVLGDVRVPASHPPSATSWLASGIWVGCPPSPAAGSVTLTGDAICASGLGA